MTERLFLEELEAFDPHSSQCNSERRFLCPFCGVAKPKDSAHRCFNVNTRTGAFFCQRCEQKGKLADFWEERPTMNRRDFARQQLRQVCELRPVQATQPDAEQERKADELRARFEKLAVVQGTPGAVYLQGRGISLEVAQAAGVRFSHRWMPEDRDAPSRAAVVFPIFNHAGELVAAQGRYTDGQSDRAKAKTRGPKSKGVFSASDAFYVPPFILTEAPIDALSLAVAGFPAVAFCGKTGPNWLPKFCFGRTVFLGFDADESGDDAAKDLTPILESFGAMCKRLRPKGAKDWNEFLSVYGRETLAKFITHAVFSET